MCGHWLPLVHLCPFLAWGLWWADLGAEAWRRIYCLSWLKKKKKKARKRCTLTLRKTAFPKYNGIQKWCVRVEVNYPMAGTSLHLESDSPCAHLHLKWKVTYLKLKNEKRVRNLGRKSQRQRKDSLWKSYPFKLYSSSCEKSWAYHGETLEEPMSCLILAK